MFKMQQALLFTREKGEAHVNTLISNTFNRHTITDNSLQLLIPQTVHFSIFFLITLYQIKSPPLVKMMLLFDITHV